ncbi:MAG: phosphoribosylformylglycinamidine synthase subunit PurL [candidate division WOR-3 bacterium]|nr:phosphoribosylformylglycinamidine synthase subunit PurL [candidate division WOR-3 bacterium]
MPRVWEIAIQKKGFNPEVETLKKSIQDLGIKEIKDLSIIYLYYLFTDLPLKVIKKITRDFICDTVSERFTVKELSIRSNKNLRHTIEVVYKPGVMDPVAENVMVGLKDLGYQDCLIRTSQRYVFPPNLSVNTIKKITENLLYNPLVQEIVKDSAQILEIGYRQGVKSEFAVQYVEILNKTKAQLRKISRERLLALNDQEMLTIQSYYRKLGRNPTDVELETFAQTWSEHCKHKTFSARIIFDDGKQTQIINGLLKSYIKKVTQKLNKKWCLSVFEDNSGVIEFDKQYGISFKVETHNHPSALEPYGGAATGIGGVIRDCLGTGLGAKPILNTDVFCFAPPDLPLQKIPAGVLSPKRIIKGVVKGVRDYGNRMGIPTASGCVCFHEGFVCNPLVYCGTVGLIPKNKIKKKIVPEDLIVLIGGRTGRDGIHGVTFASLELDNTTQQISSSVVQIGNPIEEKKITDLLISARDQSLFNAITDCGGGGLSSAIGELAKSGAEVDLEKVPLKYAGLSYTEIWISESQERMILFVPSKNLSKLLDLCKLYQVEASVIGRVTDTGKLHLRYWGREVGNIDLNFLHQGLPQKTMVAKFHKPTETSLKPEQFLIKRSQDYNRIVLEMLSDYNVASKEWIVRQYDLEVQGNTIIKPFVGKYNEGPSDACVLQPRKQSKKGVVIGCGIASQYQNQDPYWTAATAIDEAIRNIVAVGGDPDKTALLDNFCWGNPERPEILAGLVRACQACYDIARIYGTPFISGKDSLYNEYKSSRGKTISIPATLLISAVSIIPDINKTVTMDFKQADDLIYLIGKTYPEFNSSKVNPKLGIKIFRALYKAIQSGLVSACHDLSEGGLAIALAEMCLAGNVGAEIFLKNLKVFCPSIADKDNICLFSQSNTRFICAVSSKNQRRFEKIMGELPHTLIGKTNSTDRLKVYGSDNLLIINLKIQTMKYTWQTTLSKALISN